MLYLYDQAIVDDISKSFNPMNVPDPVVKVISAESIIQVAAQIQDDKIKFPIVAVVRDQNSQIDTRRTNFTRMHKGVSAVFDNENNEFYYERAIPMDISYTLSVLATNIADLDELVRELIFKYTSMYFLSIRLPYEADRKVRFGVVIDADAGIQRNSGGAEYLENGTIYEAVITLKCEGCVLVHYTPVKLRRTDYETVVTTKGEEVK